jgi:hypothetical protein
VKRIFTIHGGFVPLQRSFEYAREVRLTNGI